MFYFYHWTLHGMLCCHICSQLLFNSVIGFAWNTFVIFFLLLIITIWLLDKMQKWTCRVVGPTLAASLESLAHHQNFAGLSFLHSQYFRKCLSELVQLIHTSSPGTLHSDWLHDFSITIPRCYKMSLWNS